MVRCRKTFTAAWQQQEKWGRTERFNGRRWAGKVPAHPEWGSRILYPQTSRPEVSHVGWAPPVPQSPGRAGWKYTASAQGLVTTTLNSAGEAGSSGYPLWRQMEKLSRDGLSSDQATWSDRYSSTFNYNQKEYFYSHLFHNILDNTQKSTQNGSLTST